MTEQDIRGLIEPRNFINAWFRELPNHKTYELAYEAVESIYEGYFRRRRYKDYDSFRVVKSRIVKANGKK